MVKEYLWFLEERRLRLALTIVFIIVAIALTCLVLSQEGKDQGFGSALTGAVETYYSKNKKHTRKEVIKRVTAVLGCLFIVLALLLSSKWVK